MLKSFGMKKIGKVKSHFKNNDTVIYRVIVKMKEISLPEPVKSTDYFSKLCREIIAQQLASKAAHAIIERFYNLFSGKKVTPGGILKLSDQELRNVGMSWAKVRYIKDLAQKVKSRAVAFEKLNDLDDEAVIEELIKVKGIGRWTAEMFLMFTLGREDVFSHGDLGLRKAIKKLYCFKEMPTIEEVEKIVSCWSPYKTYGCLALWSIFD